ncbi:MAG: hypothetical protein Q8N53_00290 [Longimicrobiales bacterium]|nr:hypothetical protein [Longimicrobiales bacterium]
MDDPVYAASMMLHLMRTMRILERSQEAADALQRIRDPSGEWSAARDAQIALDALTIVHSVVQRVLPNPQWATGWAVSAHCRPGWPEDYLRSRVEGLLEEANDPEELAQGLRALVDDDNRNVERVMRLLLGFFENLSEVARAAERIGDSVRPDPSSPGGARVRTGTRGPDPSIVAACVKALLTFPEIARLCASGWDAESTFHYDKIKNTQEVREALHRRLKGYPYYFDEDEIDPRLRGPLWTVLNTIQRGRVAE